MGYTPYTLKMVRNALNGDIIGETTLRLFGQASSVPHIDLVDTDTIYLYFPNGKGLWFVDQTGSSFLNLNWVTPDSIIETYTNYNLFLKPHGTGKVKFGTHTGSGDVACNGSIGILDAAGNARKLMTTA